MTCEPALRPASASYGLSPTMSASSGSTPEWWHAARKISGSGFECSASSDDAEHSKPDPDIFLAACHHSGVDPEDALIVGDSPYDAEAGRKAGSHVIGVLCGGFPEDWLRSAGCEAIY